MCLPGEPRSLMFFFLRTLAGEEIKLLLAPSLPTYLAGKKLELEVAGEEGKGDVCTHPTGIRYMFPYLLLTVQSRSCLPSIP